MKRFLLGCLVKAFIGLLCAIVLVLSFAFLGVTYDLSKTQTQITALEAEFSAAVSELSLAKSELAMVTAELSSLESENKKLRLGGKHRLHNPTYKEVMDFVAADLTNTRQYIKGEYMIRHFSRDVVNAAKEKGLRCAFIIVIFPDGKGVSLVAFQTIDAGLVFINPQDDKVMKVAKGGRYWKDNGYTVPYDDYDDTIVDILIYW